MANYVAVLDHYSREIMPSVDTGTAAITRTATPSQKLLFPPLSSDVFELFAKEDCGRRTFGNGMEHDLFVFGHCEMRYTLGLNNQAAWAQGLELGFIECISLGVVESTR